jgi:hypothetical protein
VLTDEPGGYNGFNGLFGAAYVNPIIKPTGLMTDLDGNVIQDATGHVGFPGFDVMEATVSLAWIAQMQEAGIPITYAYSRTHMMPTAFRAASTPPTVRARSATPSNCRRTIRPFRNSSTGSRPTELPDCGGAAGDGCPYRDRQQRFGVAKQALASFHGFISSQARHRTVG